MHGKGALVEGEEVVEPKPGEAGVGREEVAAITRLSKGQEHQRDLQSILNL